MSTPRSVVLMYHRVGDALAETEELDYSLPPDLFRAQLRWLATSGRPVMPLAALPVAPDGSVVLTFDDGCDTDATVAAPLLAELGLPAAFFVSPARLGAPGYLSWNQLREIASRGFAVGSHGLDHSLLADLTEEELKRQIVESKRQLEEGLASRIDALSLPGGRGGSRALGVARDAGFRLVLGSRPGVVDGAAPADVLPRFAVRRAGGLGRFRAAVEQRPLFRAGQHLRYGTIQLARTILGTMAYDRLRAVWMHGPRSLGSGPTP